MFDAVQHPERIPARTIAIAAAVAIAFHAGVIAFMLIVGASTPPEPKQEEDLTFVAFRPPPPPPPPPAPARVAVQTRAQPTPRPRRKPEVPVVARNPAPPPNPVLPPPEPAVIDEPPAQDPADALASASGGPPGGVPGGVEGGTGDATAFAGETVALSVEMEKPVFVSGDDPKWTREALESGAGGLVVARCVLTQSGELTRCELLKRVEHMDDAVMTSLRTRRYRPAMLHGRPVSVHYVVKFRLVPPAR